MRNISVDIIQMITYMTVVIQTNDSFSEPDTGGVAQSEHDSIFADQGYIRPELLGYGAQSEDRCPLPSPELLEHLWSEFKKQIDTQESGTAANRKRIQITLPPEPEEEISELPLGVGFWELLDGWARNHQVDTDLALLICACATANAAGSRNVLCRVARINQATPPTLIGDSEDVGFHLAVKAAIEPFLSIQKELEPRYEPLRRKSYRRMSWARLKYKIDNAGALPYEFNVRGIYQNLEPEGTVRFIVEGKLPQMPYKALFRCHHHTAMSVGEIEELPRTRRAKELRTDQLSGIVSGYNLRKYAIRGFMRFSAEDLDWLFTERASLAYSTLHLRNECREMPVGDKYKEEVKAGFDRIHRKTARHIMRCRYDDSEWDVDFGDDQAALVHEQLGEAFTKDCESVFNGVLKSGVIYYLIVWYLLQLKQASGIQIEPMDIVLRSHEVACRLRRRYAAIQDHYDAVRAGRLKRKQVLRVLERMLRLGVPSTPRDLVRGLNEQRMGKIRPLIDFLLEHHILILDQSKLSAAQDARERFERLPFECFMPALREVINSLSALFDRAEQRQSNQAAAHPLPQTPTKSDHEKSDHGFRI